MAFPTTGVLDTFDRANNASLGANWSALPAVSALRCRIVGNAAGPDVDTGTAYPADYYNVATYGPDSEVYVTVTAWNSEREIFLRLQSPDAAATTDGYSAYGPASGTGWTLNRYDNGAFTVLGASFNFTAAANDTIGIEAIGTTIKFWHKPSAGSWTELASRTDSTYNLAGYLGMVIQENPTAARNDDFGGGTAVTVAAAVASDYSFFPKEKLRTAVLV